MIFKIGGQNVYTIKRIILGTGAQMFRIAGPVLVYGTLAAVIYGVVYYIFLK